MNRIILIAVLLFGLTASASARLDIIKAEVTPKTAVPNEVLTYQVNLQGDGEVEQLQVEPPDFGKLQILEGPVVSTSHSVSWINGQSTVTFMKRVTWRLMANAPGTYPISAARVFQDGYYRPTHAVQVTIGEEDLTAFPESWAKEGVSNPRTANTQISRQLRGLATLRALPSKEKPYVGEPIIIDYWFFYDRDILTKFGQPNPSQLFDLPQPEGAIREVLYQAQKIKFERTQLEGREFDRALIYRLALTPTRPGKIEIGSFGLRFNLPLPSNSHNNRGSSMSNTIFGRSPFSRATSVDVISPALTIDVQPIPAAPPDYSNTVGSYVLDSSIDRTTANEGDIVTITVTIQGQGTVDQLSKPELEGNKNFELYDVLEKKKESWYQGGTLMGRKIFEYVLRTKRGGKLHTPTLQYVIFDPQLAEFRTLTLESYTVDVTPANRPAGPNGAIDPSLDQGFEFDPDSDDTLRHVRPTENLERRGTPSAIESVLFWVLQIAAVLLATVALVRARRRDRIDPVEVRRDSAYQKLEAKIEAIKTSSTDDREEIAQQLETAIREFIADRHNVSPSGLTTDEIKRLAVEDQLDPDKADELTSIVGNCADIRYAPGTNSDEIGKWGDRALELLEAYK